MEQNDYDMKNFFGHVDIVNVNCARYTGVDARLLNFSNGLMDYIHKAVKSNSYKAKSWGKCSVGLQDTLLQS